MDSESGSVIEFGGVRILTINAAASALGTSRRTVYRLIERGQLASFPHAGKTFITCDEIKNYFARLQQNADLARAKREKAHRKVAA